MTAPATFPGGARRYGQAMHHDRRPMIALTSTAYAVLRHLADHGGEALVAVIPGLDDRHPSDRDDVVAELEFHGLVTAEQLDPHDPRVLPLGPSGASRIRSLERPGLARRGRGSDAAPWLLKLTPRVEQVRTRPRAAGDGIRRR